MENNLKFSAGQSEKVRAPQQQSKDPVHAYDYPVRHSWMDGYNNRCEDYHVLAFCSATGYGPRLRVLQRTKTFKHLYNEVLGCRNPVIQGR